MRLAKHLAHAGVASRRAAEVMIAEGRVTGRRRDGHRPGPRRHGRRGDHRRRRPRSGARRAASSTRSTSRPGSSRPRTTRTAARRSSTSCPRPGRGCIPSAASTPTRPGSSCSRTTATSPTTSCTRATRCRARTGPRSCGGPVGDAALRALREGVELDDGRTAPARVRRLRPDVLEITIREGRKRQVRRMGEAVGHPVLALRRIAFGPLDLGDLAAGAHRRLTAPRSTRCARRRAGRARPGRADGSPARLRDVRLGRPAVGLLPLDLPRRHRCPGPAAAAAARHRGAQDARDPPEHVVSCTPRRANDERWTPWPTRPPRSLCDGELGPCVGPGCRTTSRGGGRPRADQPQERRARRRPAEARHGRAQREVDPERWSSVHTEPCHPIGARRALGGGASPAHGHDGDPRSRPRAGVTTPTANSAARSGGDRIMKTSRRERVGPGAHRRHDERHGGDHDGAPHRRTIRAAAGTRRGWASTAIADDGRGSARRRGSAPASR